MKIALDAIGGDDGINVTIPGAVEAVGEFGHDIILVGPKDIIESELAKYGPEKEHITVVEATQVIDMGEHPAKAVRQKKNASIVVACNLVAENKADAVVSMGNTGATMAAALLKIKRIKGIERPALAIPMPTIKGASLLLDVGANAECKPVQLMQFAVMGSVYYSSLMSVDNPTVGLLNIGEEEEKGNELSIETHRLLKSSDLNFIGNVEGKDIPAGNADVVVCDGFVGNVILKFAEGMGNTLFDMIKEEISRSLLYKMGALAAKNAFSNVKKRMDYTEYGGALLLGVNGITIIGHGRSNAKAVKNAIGVAIKADRDGVVDTIARRVGLGKK